MLLSQADHCKNAGGKKCLSFEWLISACTARIPIWLSTNCAASHCLACPPAAGRVVKVLSAFVLPPQPAAAAAGARQGLVSPPSCTCTPAIVTVLPFHHPAGGFKCHRLVNDITCYMVWCMQVVSNKFGSGNDINYNQTLHKSEKRRKKWRKKSKEHGIR